MFNLSGSEVIFLLLMALIILGPEKLPEMIRKFGKTYGELKRMSTGFQSELREAFDEPLQEMRSTADALKRAIDDPVSETKAMVTSTADAVQQTASGADVAAEPVRDPYPAANSTVNPPNLQPAASKAEAGPEADQRAGEPSAE